jgi:16S rRNA (guanine527-N7)-methyltransferase
VKRLERSLGRYCELISAADVSVTAHRTPEAIRAELVDDALAAREVIGSALPPATADVGSGNGSPGIPLALAYDAPVTLVEAAGRKARFLEAVARELELEVTVVAERSELYARGPGRDAFDLVLARALAPPPVALELCLPLARPGGRVLLWTGPIDAFGLEPVARLVAGHVTTAVPYRGGRLLVEVEKAGPTPERFPRRPGMAGKRPLASLPSMR